MLAGLCTTTHWPRPRTAPVLSGRETVLVLLPEGCGKWRDPPPPARYPAMWLAQDLAEHVKPVFDHLCDEELLGKCLLGCTQNQNESLNSVIWRQCPKVSHARIHSVEIAVHLAILTFNHGMKGLIPLYERFCGPILPATLKLFSDTDQQRVSKAKKMAKDAQKQQRQHLQSMALARESERIAAEGTTYESSAF